MIDDDTKMQFVVSQFNHLERLLAECLEFIPFIDNNKQIISPKFVPLIVDSCGLIESIFKEYLGNNDNRIDMKKYSKMIEPYLELEDAISIFLYSPIAFLNPFSNWTRKSPDWWDAYNKLKHDRLNNYNVATYETVMQAMVGLHQVISRNVDFVPLLLSSGWFNSDSEDIGELIVARSQSNGIPIQVISVESKLFVSPLHSNFITYNEGEPVVKDCIFTNRVKDMITVYEWF